MNQPNEETEKFLLDAIDTAEKQIDTLRHQIMILLFNPPPITSLNMKCKNAKEMDLIFVVKSMQLSIKKNHTAWKNSLLDEFRAWKRVSNETHKALKSLKRVHSLDSSNLITLSASESNSSEYLPKQRLTKEIKSYSCPLLPDQNTGKKAPLPN